MLGLLVFTFLGSAEIQPWAVIPVDSDAPDSDDSGGDGDATGVNNNRASTEESAGDIEQLILWWIRNTYFSVFMGVWACACIRTQYTHTDMPEENGLYINGDYLLLLGIGLVF